MKVWNHRVDYPTMDFDVFEALLGPSLSWSCVLGFSIGDVHNINQKNDPLDRLDKGNLTSDMEASALCLPMACRVRQHHSRRAGRVRSCGRKATHLDTRLDDLFACTLHLCERASKSCGRQVEMPNEETMSCDRSHTCGSSPHFRLTDSATHSNLLVVSICA